MNQIIKYTSVILLTFIYSIQIYSQINNIHMGFGNEVSVAVNPTDPDNIAAGANLHGYFFSFDAGQSWTQEKLESTYGVWGDPSLTFDSKGNLYYAHLSGVPGPTWLDRMVIQKSTDGGITWDDGTGIGADRSTDHDKEWITCDMTDSKFSDRLYLSWTEFDKYYFPGQTPDPSHHTRILFSYSDDHGKSWKEPIVISDTVGSPRDGDEAMEGAVSVVGINGEVYICWAGHENLYFDMSTDGGETFGKDKIIAKQPGGWWYDVPGFRRCNGMPVIKCDISDSPYRGTIYVNFTDQRKGTDDTDAYLIKSTDGGDTWSDIKIIHEETDGHQFLSWMDVDPYTGFLYFIYYADSKSMQNYTDVFVARSTDGGETFENFRISEESFQAKDQIFLGDYNNIAAYNGRIYPVFTSLLGGRASVIAAPYLDTSVVDVKYRQKPKQFSLNQSYPNPFHSFTTIKYTLPETAHVKLKIYSSTGELIDSLVDGIQNAGMHVETWKPESISHGIYFYSLEYKGNRIVKSCLKK